MSHYVLPALFALFVWWFSTGAIIYLDGLPRRTFGYSMIGATLAFFFAVWFMASTSHDTTIRGAYAAFACGVFAWGWQEISFYMGFVTGPRTAPCPEGCSGWKHFLHAIQTSLWHELAIIASGALVVAVTWHAPNKVGMWTFMVLWWMHQSAKLNVFLGVRNLNEEFLPEHLAFLKSFLTKKPMNLLFPVSITVSTVICAIMVQRATAGGGSAFVRSGYTFLATMMALAIIEHWFLVLPLPAQKLWSWGLASRKPSSSFAVEVIAGFLGAGKTTYLRRLLANPAPAGRAPGKTIVLVNDFAAVGLDGALLSGQGADVVELPNGCICCSLRQDLARQLADIVGRYAPDRVLIEPSGVADLAALLGVLNGERLAPIVRETGVTTVLDAGAFLADFARMGGHIEAQLRLADLVIVNKTDVVSQAILRTICDTVRAVNPEAGLAAARFGLIDLSGIPAPSPASSPAWASAGLGIHPVHAEPHAHAAHAHGDEPGHDHAHDTLGLSSWSAALGAACDAGALQDLLDGVVVGNFGEVERIKGVARAGEGWVRFDVAGGRASMSAFSPRSEESPRVVAIGRRVDEARLAAAFDACAAA